MSGIRSAVFYWFNGVVYEYFMLMSEIC